MVRPIMWQKVFFSELGAEVVAIGVEPNGLNINDGVGSTSPEALQKRVVELRADMGIAFDGDGDRVMFVDSDGQLVDGDELLYIMASGAERSAAAYRGVVGTLMTNMGIELAIRTLGMELARAKVGDRYVKAIMREKAWALGGESSGHLICSDVSTTGDGIVSALKVLEVLVKQDKSLQQALALVSKFPQKMINVRVKDKSVITDAAVVDAVQSAEAELGDRGRVLLRPSGTEPVVRVMVEAEDVDLVDHHVNSLAEVVEKAST